MNSVCQWLFKTKTEPQGILRQSKESAGNIVGRGNKGRCLALTLSQRERGSDFCDREKIEGWTTQRASGLPLGS